MVTAVAERPGAAAEDPELRALSKDVHPEKVLDTMERREKEVLGTEAWAREC